MPRIIEMLCCAYGGITTLTYPIFAYVLYKANRQRGRCVVSSSVVAACGSVGVSLMWPVAVHAMVCDCWKDEVNEKS